jgi:peptidyl-prolyl cis-trans isomerase A (cyclophilin A)
MKAILLGVLSIACVAAQTPAHPAPAKAPARTGATAASRRTTGSAATGRKAPMLNPAAYKAKAPEEYQAKFTTTKGAFTIDVHRDWAPLGADRFYNLVKGGFYNGAPLFRIISGFMAQFGISPVPAVNKAWDKATIKDDPVKQSNKRSYVSFATAGPNTRTTQVFVNYADNSRLDSQGFAPFGIVTEGMDVVDKFYSGYGETPDQGKLNEEGKAYFEKNFPQMDTITTAVIVPAAAPAKPATSAKPTAPAK